MRFPPCVLAAAAVAALCYTPLASAHPGPRIWLGSDGGRVATYAANSDAAPTVYSATRLFTSVIEHNVVDDIWATEFPGYQVRADGGGVPHGSFAVAVAGPLLYFDRPTARYRTVAEQFGSPGPVPQLAISGETDFVTTGAGPVGGFPFFTYAAAGDHAHLTYEMFGNGASSGDGPAGVYALPLTLVGAGLSPSQPFYLLLGDDVPLGSPTFAEAIAAANQTLVPEPAAVGVLAAGGLLLLARRRGRSAR